MVGERQLQELRVDGLWGKWRRGQSQVERADGGGHVEMRHLQDDARMARDGAARPTFCRWRAPGGVFTTARIVGCRPRGSF